MITAGMDVGIEYTKAVILKDGAAMGKAQGHSGGARRAEHVCAIFGEALAEAGIPETDAPPVCATGKGKFDVTFARKRMTEPAAAVRAARHFFPQATAVVSVGADETIVATIGEDGGIEEFTFNQKCAAGLGILLDALSERLGIPVEEMGRLEGEAPVINDGCPVFTELDALSLLNGGQSPEQTALAAIDAIAVRAATTIHDITNPSFSETVLIGGLAKNAAFVRALERRTGIRFHIPESPEYASALGAAL